MSRERETDLSSIIVALGFLVFSAWFALNIVSFAIGAWCAFDGDCEPRRAAKVFPAYFLGMYLFEPAEPERIRL